MAWKLSPIACVTRWRAGASKCPSSNLGTSSWPLASSPATSWPTRPTSCGKRRPRMWRRIMGNPTLSSTCLWCALTAAADRRLWPPSSMTSPMLSCLSVLTHGTTPWNHTGGSGCSWWPTCLVPYLTYCISKREAVLELAPSASYSDHR